MYCIGIQFGLDGVLANVTAFYSGVPGFESPQELWVLDHFLLNEAHSHPRYMLLALSLGM